MNASSRMLLVDRWSARRTFILIAILLSSVSFAIRAELLDFNSPPVQTQDPHGPGQPYIEDGFRFQTLSGPGGSIIRFNPSYLPGVLPDNGTPYFGATIYSAPHMDRVDGALFSISQIDLSDYSLYAGGSSVVLLGNKGDGSHITTTLALSPWDGSFHTSYLDSNWNNLQSVDLLTQAGVGFVTQAFAWDNIVVTVIPEPTTCRLLFIGAVALLYRPRVRT